MPLVLLIIPYNSSYTVSGVQMRLIPEVALLKAKTNDMHLELSLWHRLPEYLVWAARSLKFCGHRCLSCYRYLLPSNSCIFQEPCHWCSRSQNWSLLPTYFSYLNLFCWCKEQAEESEFTQCVALLRATLWMILDVRSFSLPEVNMVWLRLYFVALQSAIIPRRKNDRGTQTV